MRVEMGSRAGLESQNDLGYLTGRHSEVERDQQIRTPAPREKAPAGEERTERFAPTWRELGHRA
ncbi:MAG: hypothetical protein ACYC4L_13785 [Chloroflexota bacterium]